MLKHLAIGGMVSLFLVLAIAQDTTVKVLVALPPANRFKVEASPVTPGPIGTPFVKISSR